MLEIFLLLALGGVSLLLSVYVTIKLFLAESNDDN
jgi:hypothetical protein